MTITGSSFAETYATSLNHLTQHGQLVPAVHDPLSPGSRFGEAPRPTREIAPYAFQIEDPKACLLINPHRIVRLAYCYGLLLWSLAGSDDVGWLEYYYPAARAFADSPQRLSGAFGHRLLATHGDQLDAAAKRLAGDPATRRAVCVIASPEDNFRGTKEYPCALATQYTTRGGRVCAFTFMRSQSAVMVLPYDVFLFCGLQLYLASTLGLPAGPYVHLCSSFHAYEDELVLAANILATHTTSVEVSTMTSGARMAQLRQLEAELRGACERGDGEPLAAALRHINKPTTFEDEAEIVLCAYAANRLGRRSEAAETIRRLPTALQELAAADLLGGVR